MFTVDAAKGVVAINSALLMFVEGLPARLCTLLMSRGMCVR